MSPRNKVGSTLFGVQQCQVLCVCVCVYAVVTPTGAGEPWPDAGNALSCDSSNIDGTQLLVVLCALSMCVLLRNRLGCPRDRYSEDQGQERNFSSP